MRARIMLGLLLLLAGCAGDAAAQEAVTLQPRNGGSIGRLAVSPDGKRLASGDQAGTVRLWDVATGRERDFGPEVGGAAGWGLPHVMAVAPDGLTLAWAAPDGSLKLWDVAE